MVGSGLIFSGDSHSTPSKKEKKEKKKTPQSKKRGSEDGESTTPVARGLGAATAPRSQEYRAVGKKELEILGDREEWLSESSDDGSPANSQPVNSTAAVTISRDDVNPDPTEADTEPEGDAESNEIVLDPTNSERQYYFDAVPGVKRDGDGDKSTDYFERPGLGLTLPLEQRWRFYQSPTGDGPLNEKTNMPPRYVILDDRACYEVYKSSIKRAFIARFWPHEFGGPGKVRTRRPHRGRPAITTTDESGNTLVPFAEVGSQKIIYSFTGEKDFKPIIYRIPPGASASDADQSTVEGSGKRKAASPIPNEPKDARLHGHNQYTPKDQLVKYGAPSNAKGRSRYLPRINTFLRRDPSPEWARDKSKLYGGMAENGRAFAAAAATQGAQDHTTTAEHTEQETSLWVDQSDDATASTKNVMGGALDFDKVQSPVPETTKMAVSTTGGEVDEDGDLDMEFPFARPRPRPRSANGPAAAFTDIQDVTDAPEPTRRKKHPRQQTVLERMAAERDAASKSEDASKTTGFNGSPATGQESELSEAKQKIAEQAADIVRLNGELGQAKSMIKELQEKVAG